MRIQERSSKIGSMEIHLHGSFVAPGEGSPTIQVLSQSVPEYDIEFLVVIGWTDDDGSEQDFTLYFEEYPEATDHFSKLVTEELFGAGDLIRRIRRRDFALRW